MIKMIKPIVNISKVIEPYNTVIVGFNGVLSEGNGVKSEAVEALIQMKRAGRHIVLLSNTALRVSSLINGLHENKLPVALFDAVVTAGEILHYKFKARQGEFAAIGSNYYKIGDARDKGVFAGLDYQPAEDISRADFIYMDAAAKQSDVIEDYLPTLEHAAGMGIPLVCAGNDTSSYKTVKFVWLREPLPSNMPFSAEKSLPSASPMPKLSLMRWTGFLTFARKMCSLSATTLPPTLKALICSACLPR